MELTYIKENVDVNFDRLKQQIVAEAGERPVADYLNQYNPKKHKITDASTRPDKIISNTAQENGIDVERTSTVPVARLPIPVQKKIVRLAAAFLCGNPIKLIADPINDLSALVQKVWDDNKLDYESKGIAKKRMSETHVAELWYTEATDKSYWSGTANEGKTLRFRVKILSPEKGDGLYPVFNMHGDMIACARGYMVKDGNRSIEHFDIYTNDLFIYSEKQTNGWVTTKEISIIGKIPIIYHSQDYPEWHDVQEMIERWELVNSNHADTNDYHASPILKASGSIKGFSSKGETGKIVEMDAGADLDYVSWDHATDSIELEQKNLRSLIYDMTDTPDISIEQMKALGTYSGIALKMLFMGAHLKASDNEESYGKGIQRRINYLKAALLKINPKLQDTTIKPKFEYFLPKNETEMIDMLTTAVSGGVISQRSAVALNPFVSDGDAEFQQIQNEGLNNQMNDE